MELVSPRDRFAAELAARARALDTPTAEGAYNVPGAGLLALFLLAAGLGMFTSNPALTAAAILVLPVFMALLWRRGEPPVLLFAVGFQWVQVVTKVFQANSYGVTVAELTGKPSIGLVVWLSLLGLLVLAVGMRLMLRRLGEARLEQARRELAAIRPVRAFWLYVALSVLAEVISTYAWSAGGLAQQMIALSEIRWIGLFLFAYVALAQKKMRLLLLAVVAYEVIGGIGFFAGFKTPIFVLLIAVGTVRYNVRPSSVALAALLIGVLFYAGAAWTAVKGEYRQFLNDGTRSQNQVVTQTEAVLGLFERLAMLSHAEVMDATHSMYNRLAYVEYFTAVTEYVPAARPHGEGEIWKASLMHVLMPRALFPDKPRLPSDSELTMEWTGYYLASEAEGTSISIGYMGESYADFGVPGMFVPVFLIGLLWGGIYVWFVRRSPYVLVGYAFAVAMLVGAYQFEMAGIKLLGGTLNKFIVFALMMRFFGGKLGRWLTAEQAAAPQERAAPAAAASGAAIA